jgi:hypothetical protein
MTIPRASLDSVRLPKFVSSWRAPRGHFDAYLDGPIHAELALTSSIVSERRFSPPWSVDEQPAYFVVRDHDGQQLAYVYFEDEAGRRGEENRGEHCEIARAIKPP